jgi:methyl-accepting chemotaxis protein
MLTQAGGMGDLSEKTRLAHDGFMSYARDFAALVNAEVKLGLNETLGLSGSLRAAVHDIEAKLKEIDNPRSTSWMLMMRRHEKDFMLRRDQKYVGELKKAAAEFSKSLAATEIPSALTAEITLELEKYQNEFSAWADTAQQTAGYDAAMMKTFRGLEPLIVEVGQSVERGRGSHARLGKNMDADRIWTGGRSCRRVVVADRSIDIDGTFGNGSSHDQAGGW